MVNFPNHLKINGQTKRKASEFKDTDKLYRGFKLSDLDSETNQIKTEVIKFPDFSCNWEVFSTPEDVKYRQNGNLTDGCFSFTVETSKYKNFAKPIHDPIEEEDYENYSHVEVRQLSTEELDHPPDFEPAKKRKGKFRKSDKLEYRINLCKKAYIELKPQIDSII